jgi:hypothetical protein
LPDFSWHNIPKCWKNIPGDHKTYQMTKKFTNLSVNISNGHKIYQHRKTLQNLPKIGFLVLKYTIWQPCLIRYICTYVLVGFSNSFRKIGKNFFLNKLLASFRTVSTVWIFKTFFGIWKPGKKWIGFICLKA